MTVPYNTATLDLHMIVSVFQNHIHSSVNLFQGRGGKAQHDKLWYKNAFDKIILPHIVYHRTKFFVNNALVLEHFWYSSTYFEPSLDKEDKDLRITVRNKQIVHAKQILHKLVRFIGVQYKHS